MNLGIILASGDSFTNMVKNGQDKLFKDFYLKKFSESFDKVYIFSYKDEMIKDLPNNVRLIPNDLRLHKYFYNFMMPFVQYSYFKKLDVIRAYHLFGITPAVIAKIFFGNKFVFNFAYDYFKFAKIYKHYHQIIPLTFLLFLSRFASKIFVANKNYIKYFANAKTIYLPNGVNTWTFKPKKKMRQNEVILSVGRLTRQKNFEALIGAMKGLNGKLVIIGQGELQGKLIRLAKKNNVPLELLNSVPHNKMPKYYNNADIFVSSSLIEGHPKALLEAMSSGLPIVATNVEGNNSLIVDRINGLLCDTFSKSIQASISFLIRNRKRAEILGKRARSTVTEHYDLNQLLEKEVRILKQVAKDS